MTTTMLPDESMASALPLLRVATATEGRLCVVRASAQPPYTVEAVDDEWCSTWQLSREQALGASLARIPPSPDDTLNAVAEKLNAATQGGTTALSSWIDCGVLTSYSAKTGSTIRHHLVIGPTNPPTSMLAISRVLPDGVNSLASASPAPTTTPAFAAPPAPSAPGATAAPSKPTDARDVLGFIVPSTPARNILEELHIGLPLVFATLSLYTTMLAATFVGLGDRVEKLLPAEAFAAFLAATMLAGTAAARISFMCANATKPTMADVAMLTAHLIAASANFIMATVGTPVLVDPVTGNSEYMVRWCEWISCGFFMTFVVEAVSAHTLAEPLSLGLLIGTSIVAGYVLPLCTSKLAWYSVMFVSWCCFFSLFPRFVRRMRIHRESVGKRASPSEVSALVAEQAAHKLMMSICIMWSIVVADYCLTWGLGVWLGDSWPRGEQRHQWPYIVDCILDVIAKSLYAAFVTSTHAQVPREAKKQQERWICEAMDAVWAGAQDAIILSELRADGTARTIASTGLSTIVGPEVSHRWAAWRSHFVGGAHQWEAETEGTLSSHGSAGSVSTAHTAAASAQEAIEQLVAGAWHNLDAVARARAAKEASAADDFDDEEDDEGAANEAGEGASRLAQPPQSSDTITMRWEAPARNGGDVIACEVQATRTARAVGGSEVPTPFLVLVVRDTSASVASPPVATPAVKAQHGAVAQALVDFHVKTSESFAGLQDSTSLDDGLKTFNNRVQRALSAAVANVDEGLDEADADASSAVLFDMQGDARRTIDQLCAQVSSNTGAQWAQTQRALATIKGELSSLNAVCGGAEELVAGVEAAVDELLARTSPPPTFHSSEWASLRKSIDQALSVVPEA
eukprot:CAMPEP_0119408316 /NCGR_PEP_ID=MMETSP1335-20130426/1908_1 /TAXON_ID=259385 /ORGANISM="Chrysoculter rhomboideus, Strain RCC1486" /LENGTH=856 /DNA_ID=CAMNT_0007432539 /DNA_START=59 /DNA_END=2629 /DNA_ORIENTATION=-